MASEVTLKLPALHAAQQQVLDEADRFNVLQCGRRWGKTTLGEDLGVEPMLDGHPVGWFAPTYKLLAEAERRIRAVVHDLTARFDSQQHRLELITGGSIDFWTLEKPDPGRSFKYKRVIVDEAGVVRDLEEKWNASIRPTLTDYRGDAWFLGTPKGRNYFHTLFVRGQTGEPGWKSWRFGTVANPHIAADEVDEARRGMPDQAFRQEYLGEPAEDAGNPFGIGAIHDCIAPLSTARPVAYGWDLAKSEDWTVGLALDAGGACAAFDRWQGPWTETIAKIQRQTGATRALVDSTGVGDPILEQLQRGRTNYEGFKFTASSKQQLMEGLAAAIQQRTIRFPAGPIVHELEAFQYEYTRTGVRYSAPEGMHDDCVMALALAVKKWSRPQGSSVPPSISRVTLR